MKVGVTTSGSRPAAVQAGAVQPAEGQQARVAERPSDDLRAPLPALVAEPSENRGLTLAFLGCVAVGQGAWIVLLVYVTHHVLTSLG